jgi:hypothetical protein
MPDELNIPLAGRDGPAPAEGEVVSRLRQQLAQLLGRLLARCWLRSRYFPSAQKEDPGPRFPE